MYGDYSHKTHVMIINLGGDTDYRNEKRGGRSPIGENQSIADALCDSGGTVLSIAKRG